MKIKKFVNSKVSRVVVFYTASLQQHEIRRRTFLHIFITYYFYKFSMYNIVFSLENLQKTCYYRDKTER